MTTVKYIWPSKRYVLGIANLELTLWDELEGKILDRIKNVNHVSVDMVDEFINKVREMNNNNEEFLAYTEQVKDYVTI